MADVLTMAYSVASGAVAFAAMTWPISTLIAPLRRPVSTGLPDVMVSGWAPVPGTIVSKMPKLSSPHLLSR